MAGLKVKYIGNKGTLAFERNKVYEVMSIERQWYRIMTELDEDYLFPPEQFEIVEDGCNDERLERMKGACVKYIGNQESHAFVYGKTYEVLGAERGYYRIMTELGRECLCAPEWFEPAES